jgi:hypothetical protein
VLAAGIKGARSGHFLDRLFRRLLGGLIGGLVIDGSARKNRTQHNGGTDDCRQQTT